MNDDKATLHHEAAVKAVMGVIGGDFCHGTTLRRWYIGQALTGVPVGKEDEYITATMAAEIAIERADAVLRQLAEEHLKEEEQP
mgnify:CR=1 FL=1